jgi:hypothetical protein
LPNWGTRAEPHPDASLQSRRRRTA